MDAQNMVVLRGEITSEPLVRELPSGGVVTQLDVTTRVDGRAVPVPVAVHDRPITVAVGDEVVVTGHVHRRFFRVAGATQSRTEVVAAAVIRATRRRAVERALGGVVAQLGTATGQ